MSEFDDLKGKFAQILVLNYLQHVYTHDDCNVHLYSEVINDVDIFDKQISYDALKHDKPNIETFINLLSDNSVNLLETLEVKHVKEFRFKNIIQVLTKIWYPNNTKIKLVYIPVSNQMRNDLIKLIEEFNRQKQTIINLNANDRYTIYNNFINGTSHYNEDILFVIEYYLKLLAKNKLHNDYKTNITHDVFNMLDSNFNNFSIELITRSQLCEYPLSKDIVYDIIGYVADEDQI